MVDSDRDGVQDPGEQGIAGVTLSITNADGSPVTDVFGNPVATTTTDATGHYSFDHLPLGTYKVTVTQPAGFVPTIPGAQFDSAADSSTGSAESLLLLGDGQRDSSLDFGFYPAEVSVGDFVWWDSDRDGVQDPGEQGIDGVTLSITNADGSPVVDVFGNPVTTTTTDADGRYSFDHLPPGTYKVTVSPPTGFLPTVAGAGSDAAADSSTGSATSAVLTDDGQRDPTLDFGFYPDVPPSTTTTTTTTVPDSTTTSTTVPDSSTTSTTTTTTVPDSSTTSSTTTTTVPESTTTSTTVPGPEVLGQTTVPGPNVEGRTAERASAGTLALTGGNALALLFVGAAMVAAGLLALRARRLQE
ncbi:MAG: SdrD B-like domain-containing protein [Actinomycetes bacterium]